MPKSPNGSNAETEKSARRILIVEDNLILQQMIAKRIAISFGLTAPDFKNPKVDDQIVIVSRADEAVERIKDAQEKGTPFGVIVTDNNLSLAKTPAGTNIDALANNHGVALIENVRQLEKDKNVEASSKVVFVMHSSDDVKSKALSAGANDFVQKPDAAKANTKDLVKILEKYLGKALQINRSSASVKMEKRDSSKAFGEDAEQSTPKSKRRGS